MHKHLHIFKGKFYVAALLGVILILYLMCNYEEDNVIDDNRRPILSPKEGGLPSNQRHLFHTFDTQHPTLPTRFQVVDFRANLRPEWTPNKTSYACVRSTTSPPFTVCLYPLEKDVYISRSLYTSGQWEPYITKAFITALERFPGATVIDVGANIGYYSLLASTLGHKVIAIEPQEENIKRFISGMQSDPWNENILLLANVLSNKHQNVSLSSSEDNQGGLHVLENCNPTWSWPQPNHCRMVTLTFDDLLYVVTTKTAIIKVDIEGYECKALAMASHFFSAITVPYIFMEWRQMTDKRLMPRTMCPVADIDALGHFLSNLGYVPHEIRSGIKLNAYKSSTWRVGDVYWRLSDQDLLVPSW